MTYGEESMLLEFIPDHILGSYFQVIFDKTDANNTYIKLPYPLKNQQTWTDLDYYYSFSNGNKLSVIRTLTYSTLDEIEKFIFRLKYNDKLQKDFKKASKMTLDNLANFLHQLELRYGYRDLKRIDQTENKNIVKSDLEKFAIIEEFQPNLFQTINLTLAFTKTQKNNLRKYLYFYIEQFQENNLKNQENIISAKRSSEIFLNHIESLDFNLNYPYKSIELNHDSLPDIAFCHTLLLLVFQRKIMVEEIRKKDNNLNVLFKKIESSVVKSEPKGIEYGIFTLDEINQQIYINDRLIKSLRSGDKPYQLLAMFITSDIHQLNRQTIHQIFEGKKYQDKSKGNTLVKGKIKELRIKFVETLEPKNESDIKKIRALIEWSKVVKVYKLKENI
jgi:hypothetical protein